MALLKVSKSQKQFFLKLHCPKTNKISDKVLPYVSGPIFTLVFIRFARIFKTFLKFRFSKKASKFDEISRVV